MGASDGRILGSLKVVDHGSELDRWNLVVMGDGYQEGEMAKFHGDARKLVAALQAVEPFSSCWNAVNVIRVDVASAESGADQIMGILTPNVSVATYFDAEYNAAPSERVLEVDQDLALDVAEQHCLERHAVIVIVNSTQYGGSGGDVAVCASGDDSIAIAIHEIGHSVFGLADEYEVLSGELEHEDYDDDEPEQPNVTTNTDMATIKWSAFLTPGVSLPSTEYQNCPNCAIEASPHPAGTVGAFEGGFYAHRKIYRPSFECKMRENNAPAFCAICQFEMRVVLTQYLPPESIIWPDEFLAFNDVPVGLGGQGITTYRALVWQVVANGPKTFRVKDSSGLPAAFGFPFGTSVTVGPSPTEPVAVARLWVSYTSTVAGQTDAGELVVERVDSGEAHTFYVGAHTIQRPLVSLALVLDCSGSMKDECADGSRKIDIARRASEMLVDVMTADDALAIVRFDQTAERLMEATLMGDENGGAGRARARGIIAGTQLEPAGHTSIGAGLEAAEESFADSATGEEPFDSEAVLVLSDGKENRSPFIRDVENLVTADTFAVGFGIPSELNVEALSALTERLDGYLVITGAPDAEQETRLKKYFLQILAGVSNAEVALDPRGEAREGRPPGRVPFFVTESDYGANILVLSPCPSGLDLVLVAPDGRRIAPGDLPGTAWARFVTGAGVSYFRLALPLAARRLGGAGAGQWTLEVSLNDKGRRYLHPEKPVKKGPQAAASRRRALPYEVVVHAYSMLRLHTSAQPGLVAVRSPVLLSARLTEFDAPLFRTANVFAEIKRPDGSVARVKLAHAGEGRYSTEVTAETCGLHTARIRAHGHDQAGWEFTRERTLTFVANKTGHDEKEEPPRQPPMGWREWTRFLLAAGVITPKKARLLERAAPSDESAAEPSRKVLTSSARRPRAKAADASDHHI